MRSYCKYFEGLDKYLLFEKGSDRFKLYNPNLTLHQFVRGHKGQLLGGSHVARQRCLLTDSGLQLRI